MIMLPPNELHNLLVVAANGNQEALNFLVAYHNYAHGVDDIIDENLQSADIIHTFVMAREMYASNYYLKHLSVLYSAMMLVTNAYEDSLYDVKDKDVLRSQGTDIIRLVALLEGGYILMRKISVQLRELSFKHQRQEVASA